MYHWSGSESKRGRHGEHGGRAVEQAGVCVPRPSAAVTRRHPGGAGSGAGVLLHCWRQLGAGP